MSQVPGDPLSEVLIEAGVLTREQVDSVFAARSNGVLLLEGFTQHFNPMMAAIAGLIEGGSLGAVQMMKSELAYTLPDWETDVRGSGRLGGGS